MMNRCLSASVVVVCLTLVFGCKQPPQQTVPVQVISPTKVVLPQPFRYHKLIESSPGKFFDVFSWGRGSYLILYSDSTGKKYSTTYGDLEGSVIDVFNTDMNMDGNPEILIEARAKDTTNHINIYAYEFRGTKGQKTEFPKLSTGSKKGYRGGDRFSIKEGSLVRVFPVYDGNGKDAKPTGKTKILQYGISDNTFTVKDISAVDTTQKASAPKITHAAVKAKADKPASKKEAHKSKKEKHTAPKHHKKQTHKAKKKHRRHSN
jgi:hypothetical protein